MNKILFLILLFTLAINAQNYQEQWSEVKVLEEKNLLKSALKKVEVIYEKAKIEDRESQLIKALLYREKYRSNLSEDGYVKAINNIEKELNQTHKTTTKLILKSILAQMYANYLDENRYKIEKRSKIKDDNSSDILLWSVDRFVKKSSQLYFDSIGDEAKKIKIEEYQEILTPAQNSEGLRPTLYDFLAFRALNYFNNERNYLTKPVYSFYIKDKEAFGSESTFIKHSFKTKDKESFKYQALLIYQKLLKFHQKMKNQKALHHINFERLQFIYRNFVGADRDEYYLQTLNSLESQYTNSEALYYLAKYYQEKDIDTKAMIYAKKGIHSTESYIAVKCQNIKDAIEEKSINFYMESVNLPHENLLAKISYKNIDKIFVRVIKLNREEQSRYYSQYGVNRDKYMKNLKSFREFSLVLPKADDYQEHTTEVSLGEYDYGHYIFLLSTDKEFNSKIVHNISSISKIAYFYRDSKLLVVNRESGEPISGLEATFYKDRDKLIVTKTSDKNGFIDLPKKRGNYRIYFQYGDDSLNFIRSEYYNGGYNTAREDRGRETLHFFTDRAIYRPAQTIYFKGLAIQTHSKKKPKILTNKKIKVTLYSTNGQKIKTKTFKSDEFGTINGSFLLSSNVLLGSMRLRSSIGGSKQIRVEEYKRPKFEVLFDKLDKSYRLGSRVTLKGRAKAYTGNGIDGAKVKYSVERVAHFPWLGWWRPRPMSQNMQIGMGEVKTDQNGEFKISFDAIADRSISREDRPSFSYQVVVDITDSTGETQSSSKTINLGFVAVNANMIIADRLEKNSTKVLKLETTNLDGNFEALKGEVVIEKFKAKDRVYRDRYWSKVDKPLYSRVEFEKLFKNYEYLTEEFRAKEKIKTLPFDTKKSKELTVGNFDQGEYLLTLYTSDKYGTKVKKSKKITIYDIEAEKPPYKTNLWQQLDKKTYKIDSKATLYIKSSTPNSFALLGIERDGKIVEERWIEIKNLTKELIAIDKKDRGDIFYHLTLIKNNRNYSQKGTLRVPWNKKLKVEYISFRDRLKPNSKEQWSIKISGEGKNRVMAQMVATMYDASLDKLVQHNFYLGGVYPRNYMRHYNGWRVEHFNSVDNVIHFGYKRSDMYRKFYHLNWFGLSIYNHRNMVYAEAMPTVVYRSAPTPAPMIESAEDGVIYEEGGMGGDIDVASVENNAYSDPYSAKEAELQTRDIKKPIQIRKNLQETMFFKPNLKTDEDGNIIIDFKTNDALTRWRFLGFVHTKDLRTALTSKEIVTQKDLMVVTNLPRFFREKDMITLQSKVVNMSDRDLNGSCELKLVDPVSEKNIYGDHNYIKFFSVKKGSSTTVSFKIKIPPVDEVSAIKHTIIARTDRHTDAEQVIRPILPNRLFVTESRSLSLKAKESRSFVLKSLRDNNSTTLKNHKLTLEFTSNPAWYAIKSLPYLMEYPHECNEQLFNRYFANALASKIANSTPKIKKIFKSWKSKKELKSALSTNKELKSILLEETPWVLDAQSQEEQQQNIGLLFDLHKLFEQQEETLDRLIKRQYNNPDKAWSWFDGGESSWYITQYIVEGFAKLKKLGIYQPRLEEPLGFATAFMDRKMLEQYRALQNSVEEGHSKFEDDHLSSIVIHYLYTRSFYSYPMSDDIKIAHDYYLKQIKKYWTTKGLYEQGMIALTLNKKGKKTEAKMIVKSLKERALSSDELGIYFHYSRGFSWDRLPIETHTMMIELFDTITHDKKVVEQLKIWLLKNRQTNHWATTKATASAIYALLLDSNWLFSDKLVDIGFDTTIEYQTILKKAKENAQKGTNYFKASFDKFDKSMATVKVTNPNSNIAWGGLYWQYFEDMDKVKGFKETPLTIDKKLFLLKRDSRGETLIPIKKQTLRVGDKVKVRIEIRVDRDMEYIMLKDSRASTFEPIDVLSQYKWQDGLGYYESIRDNATYFFIENLPRGSYIFEYPLVTTHSGEFSNGITTIESMYAPEFRSHSEGIRVRVK